MGRSGPWSRSASRTMGCAARYARHPRGCRRESGVLQAPAQALDAVGEAGGDLLGVHLLVGRDDLLDRVAARRRAGLRILVAPARFGDEALRFHPHREAVRVARKREGRGPLADRAGAHHVVAEERELVLESLAQLGKLALDRSAEP